MLHMKSISWMRFVQLSAATAFACVVAIAAFVAGVNPYGNLPVSLPYEHFRVTGNERYSFPGLLKQKRYDSAVLGTSTAMLLHPKQLNKDLGGQFINLSMASGQPWEQTQVLSLFRRTHSVRQVIVAIDVVWCSAVNAQPHLTFRPFPTWMYDENPWNDYFHLLNDRALVHAARLASIWLGLTKPPFGPDGYFQFVPDTSIYDLAKARKNIYGRATSGQTVFPDISSLRANERLPSNDPYPDIANLFRELDQLAPDAASVLFFAPYHAVSFASPELWAKWTDCKHALVRQAATRRSITVIDFMRPTTLTLNDANYWDPLHYTVEQATAVVRSLSDAVCGQNSGPLYEVLYRPGRSLVDVHPQIRREPCSR